MRLNRSEIDHLQKTRWKFLRNHLKTSPFYRNQAESQAEIQDFPIMDKAIFMKHFNEINTRNIDKERAFQIAMKAENTRDFSPTINDVSVGLSSGTTGNRGLFLVSENERAMWVACVLRRVIGWSFKSRSVAFFLRANSNLYNSVQSNLLQFHYMDLLIPIGEHIQKLNTIQPTILVAQPSVLIELAKYMENKELKINPTKIIAVAEVLYPEDNTYLKSVFNQIIHQVYQCTEGFLASTCEFGTLHFHEDYLFIEKKYLDDSKTRFHPIITDLKRKSQPVVRYELNDIIHEKTDCKCGSSAMAIEKIEGRSDDVLIFKDKNSMEIKIYPDFFRRAILFADKSIIDYTITQVSDSLIEVYLGEQKDLFQKVVLETQKILNHFHIENVVIKLAESPDFELGLKLRRVKRKL
jgi:putative adenylate-forming enzyme